MKNKISISALEQDHFLQEYKSSLNYMQKKIEMESPINSFDASSLDKGQSVPDAILTIDGIQSWVELTTFSRCEDMRISIGERRKYPDRFTGMKFISGTPINKFEPLYVGFYKACHNKFSKDYSQFSELAKISPPGTLVVRFVNDDPLFNINEFQDLISIISDKHILDGWGVASSQFNKIVLGASIYRNFAWESKYVEIADLEKLTLIRHQFNARQRILRELQSRDVYMNFK